MNLEKEKSLNLPLSWTFKTTDSVILSTNLSKKTQWLNGGNLLDFKELLNYKNIKNNSGKVIIRGVNKELAEFLGYYNFRSFLFAKEAIIELNKEKIFHKNHLRRINSLLKRGSIKEVPYNELNKKMFNNFIKNTVHSNEPRLKHLFIDKPTSDTRFFVFEFEKDRWEGGLLISQNSRTKMQGEQIFRRRNSKNGIIDTLIFEVTNILRSEGFMEFSLGEVPFQIKDNIKSFSKENILSKVGSALSFAYNSKNLYNFKDKFATRWDNLYLCSNRKISFLDIYRIGYKSNFLKLIFYNLTKF